MKTRLLLLLALVLPCLDAPAQDREEIPESVRMTPVVKAVRRVRESVVSIDIAVDAKAALRLSPWVKPRGQFFKEGSGTGVIIDREGLIITNYHVVYGLERYRGKSVALIYLQDEKKPLRAELITYSKADDLAVLRIVDRKGRTFTEITRGSSESLMVGETVIAIGNPFDEGVTVTVGVLSAKNRAAVIIGDGQRYEFKNLLTTDAAINPGNSGGPLVDLTGKLIGINNAIRSGAEGINFAIPVDTVSRLLESNLDIDKGNNYWLGMQVVPANEGLLVKELVQGGPAWLAGLRKDDLILKVGDRQVRTKKDYNMGFLATVKERKAFLTYSRGGDRFRRPVLAGDREDRDIYLRMGALVKDTQIPVETARMLYTTAEVRMQTATGVKVTHLEEKGPAFQAGIRPGDILVAFTYRRQLPVELHLGDKSKLRNSLDQYKPGGKYEFMILRNNEPFRGSMTLH